MPSVLNRKVLVLNKSWNAVGVATLKRAIILLFSEYANGEPKARIIDPTTEFQQYTWADWAALRPKDGEDYIPAGNVIFRVPEVILLSRYEKLPLQRINFSRRTLYRRDSNTCQYCGSQPGTEELTIDHIVPKSHGGKTSWENTVLACIKCNSKKANRTPEQAGMKLQRPPFKPKFNFFKGDVMINSWRSFVSEAYWSTELRD